MSNSTVGIFADLGPDARIWCREQPGEEPVFAISWQHSEIVLGPVHGTVEPRDVEKAEQLATAANAYLAACRAQLAVNS